MRYLVLAANANDYQMWRMSNYQKQSAYVTSAEHFREMMRNPLLSEWAVVKLNNYTKHPQSNDIEREIAKALQKHRSAKLN